MDTVQSWTWPPGGVLGKNPLLDGILPCGATSALRRVDIKPAPKQRRISIDVLARYFPDTHHAVLPNVLAVMM